MTAESPKALDEVPLFRDLDASLRGVLTSIAKRSVTPPRRSLVPTSGASQSIVLLIGGRATLTLADESKPRVTLGYAVPGDVFPCGRGWGDSRYSIDAQAARECTALSWSVQTIEHMAANHPLLAHLLLRVQARKMGHIARRLLDISSLQVAERVSRAVLSLCEQCGERVGKGLFVRGPVHLRHIAEMSGTTRFTVCRLLGRWRREGVLQMERDHIVISSMRRLEQIAARKCEIGLLVPRLTGPPPPR